MTNLDTIVRDWLVEDRIGVIHGFTPPEVMAKCHAIFTASGIVQSGASIARQCSIQEFESTLWRLGYGVTCDHRGCQISLPDEMAADGGRVLPLRTAP